MCSELASGGVGGGGSFNTKKSRVENPIVRSRFTTGNTVLYAYFDVRIYRPWVCLGIFCSGCTFQFFSVFFFFGRSQAWSLTKK